MADDWPVRGAPAQVGLETITAQADELTVPVGAFMSYPVTVLVNGEPTTSAFEVGSSAAGPWYPGPSLPTSVLPAGRYTVHARYGGQVVRAYPGVLRVTGVG